MINLFAQPPPPELDNGHEYVPLKVSYVCRAILLLLLKLTLLILIVLFLMCLPCSPARSSKGVLETWH